MSVEAILRDLTTRGITLIPDGDRLDIDGPEDALTDELLDQLREHKAELLALLTGQAASAEVPGVQASGQGGESNSSPEFAAALASLDEDDEDDEETRHALEERAAVAEFDGDLSRAAAERQALADPWAIVAAAQARKQQPVVEPIAPA